MLYTPPTGRVYRVYNRVLSETHLLIAGASGSGKSTVLNGSITNALYHTPNKVGFILIDPKRVELKEYRELPHVLRYVNTFEAIPGAIRAALDLVNIRLKDMERRRLRIYDGSDVYLIIDELMPIMTRPDVRKAVLPLLQDILAIGRCARMHVIACTQSPIAKVIPTELKCNFDARIALRTATAQDSRNILGVNGCEKFPDPSTEHRAWAYYRSGADTDLYDVPRYTDEERQTVIDYWTAQARPGFFARLRRPA